MAETWEAIRQEQIRVLRMIATDCVADATRRDGQPFTGAVIGQALGEIVAQTAALATILASHLETCGEGDHGAAPAV